MKHDKVPEVDATFMQGDRCHTVTTFFLKISVKVHHALVQCFNRTNICEQLFMFKLFQKYYNLFFSAQ